jgi:hypothetical protein
MIRVTISTITDRGILPGYYRQFRDPVRALNAAMADEYERMWRALAAKAGVLIRVDREMME